MTKYFIVETEINKQHQKFEFVAYGYNKVLTSDIIDHITFQCLPLDVRVLKIYESDKDGNIIKKRRIKQ